MNVTDEKLSFFCLGHNSSQSEAGPREDPLDLKAIGMTSPLSERKKSDDFRELESYLNTLNLDDTGATSSTEVGDIDFDIAGLDDI
jgi:hypothetical protein